MKKTKKVGGPMREVKGFAVALILECGHVLLIVADEDDELLTSSRAPDEYEAVLLREGKPS